MEKETTDVTMTIRLKGTQAERYYRLLEHAQVRYPELDRSKLARILMGFDERRQFPYTEIRDFLLGKSSNLPTIPEPIDLGARKRRVKVIREKS